MNRTPQWLVPVLLGALLAGCRSSSPQSVPESRGEASSPGEIALSTDPEGLRTIQADVRPIVDILQVPARIQPDPTRVIRVFPPVGGRLVAVEVRPGDRVVRGQTLAILESSEVSAARADYQKAQADAELKQKSLRRASLLFENMVLPEKEYQQAEADAAVAAAELHRSADRLRVLGTDPNENSNRLRITAPGAGVVLEIGAAPGELSKPLDSPQPLCTLADLDRIWVLGDLLEKDVSSLRPGLTAEVLVSAYPDEKWSGPISAVSDVVDPLTHTLKARVSLANPKWRLKPEMFAQMRLTRSGAPGLIVPAAAVVRLGTQAFVFVQKSARVYERRAITLGRSTDHEVEISSGLRAGEIVVAEGALFLRAAS